MLITIFVVRLGAVHTAFNAARQVNKITAAFIAEGVQRTIAKQTIKFVFIYTTMARKIFTFVIAEKFVMFHSFSILSSLFYCQQTKNITFFLQSKECIDLYAMRFHEQCRCIDLLFFSMFPSQHILSAPNRISFVLLLPPVRCYFHKYRQLQQ